MASPFTVGEQRLFSTSDNLFSVCTQWEDIIERLADDVAKEYLQTGFQINPYALRPHGDLGFITFEFIKNALDSTRTRQVEEPAHMGKIRLCYTGNKDAISCTVHDNGTGISPSLADALFTEELPNRLERKDLMKRDLIGGRGRGLTYCAQRGDRLDVIVGYTPLEEGTEFWYRCPVQTLLS